MSWFATCFSCSSPSEPVEADGATDDVVADVRPLGDAGHYLDTGLDVRPPMPPCEAGAPRDTPALPSSLWDPIPGLDPCCGDRIAKDPDLVDPPFKWELCTSGKCEKLVGSNKRGSGGTYDTWITEPLRYSEGAQILSYSRLELDVPTANIGRVVAVVQTLSPVPKRLVATAWDLEAGEACGPGPYWGPRGSVLTAPALTLSPGYLAFAPSGRYRAADLEVAKLPIYSGKSPIIPAVSAMAAFFEVGSPDYTTVSLNLTTRVFTPQPRSIGIGELLAFGDGALGRRWEPGDFFASGLGYIGPDGSGAPLLKASPGRYVFGTAGGRGRERDVPVASTFTPGTVSASDLAQCF
jgi:hypothetical protein